MRKKHIAFLFILAALFVIIAVTFYFIDRRIRVQIAQSRAELKSIEYSIEQNSNKIEDMQKKNEETNNIIESLKKEVQDKEDILNEYKKTLEELESKFESSGNIS